MKSLNYTINYLDKINKQIGGDNLVGHLYIADTNTKNEIFYKLLLQLLMEYLIFDKGLEFVYNYGEQIYSSNLSNLLTTFCTKDEAESKLGRSFEEEILSHILKLNQFSNYDVEKSMDKLILCNVILTMIHLVLYHFPDGKKYLKDYIGKIQELFPSFDKGKYELLYPNLKNAFYDCRNYSIHILFSILNNDQIILQNDITLVYTLDEKNMFFDGHVFFFFHPMMIVWKQ